MASRGIPSFPTTPSDFIKPEVNRWRETVQLPLITLPVEMMHSPTQTDGSDTNNNYLLQPSTRTRSFIHHHGTKEQKAGRIFWKCTYCPKRYLLSGGTAKPATHLRDAHPQKLRESSHPGPTPSTSAHAAPNPFQNMQSTAEFDILSWYGFLCSWIVECNVPFDMVGKPAFQSLIREFRSVVLPPPDMIKTWVLESYESAKSEMRMHLKASVTRIHFSFTRWISPDNTLGLLAIIGHFTSASGKLCNALLGIKEVKDNMFHAQAIAEIFYDLAKEYDIIEKMGYFQVGDTQFDDSVLAALMKRDQRPEEEILSPNRSVRCFRSDMDSSVRAFWFGDRDEAVVRKLFQDTIKSTRDTSVEWRELGPWGKCFNVAFRILDSPRNKRELEELGAKSMVEYHLNEGHWDSARAMLDRFLENEQVVEQFISRHPELSLDRLSSSEWAELREVRGILGTFLDCIQSVEERPAGTLYDFIPQLDFLAGKYRAMADNFPPNAQVYINAQKGLEKLMESSRVAWKVPACVAAVALDPRCKWDYFVHGVRHGECTSKAVERAEVEVRRLWEREYKKPDTASSPMPMVIDGGSSSSSSSADIGSSMRPPARGFQSDFHGWREERRRVRGDQYDRFRKAPLDQSVEDPFEYWWAQGPTNPEISVMGLDIFSIPAMAADAKRLFLDCEKPLLETSSGVGLDGTEAVECLKSWRKSGLVEPVYKISERAISSPTRSSEGL